MCIKFCTLVVFLIFSNQNYVSEAKGMKMQLPKCCALEDIIPESVMSDCTSKLESSDGKENQMSAAMCAAECVAQAIQVDDKDDISWVKMKNKIKNLQDPASKTLYQNAVQYCEEKGKKSKVDLSKFAKSKCKGGYIKSLMCIEGEKLSKCPADKKIKSPACDEHEKVFKKFAKN